MNFNIIKQLFILFYTTDTLVIVISLIQMGSQCPQVCVYQIQDEAELVHRNDYQMKEKLQLFQRQSKMNINKQNSTKQQQYKNTNQHQLNRAVDLTLNKLAHEIVELSIKGNQKAIRYKGFLITWKPSKVSKEDIVQGFCVVKQQKSNRVLFEGQYKNSMKNGYGIQYGLDGHLSYEGTFKDDKYEGWGKDQNYYGEFRNGLYDGWGCFKSPNELYCGQLKEGRYDGMGIHISGTNLYNIPGIPIKQFFMLLLDKGMTNLASYNIHEIYTGFWSNGVKNGQGKLWRQNQYWYNGQFSQNNYHGIGALFDPQKDTAVIQGAFKKGQFVKKQ